MLLFKSYTSMDMIKDLNTSNNDIKGLILSAYGNANRKQKQSKWIKQYQRQK